MVRLTVLVVFIFVLISHSYSKDLPSHFPKCKRNETLSSPCLVEASNLVRDSLSKGIKELGIPSIDPLIIPSLSFEQGTNALNFKIHITNATITGLKDYNFSKFWFDPTALTWYNHGTVGSISLVGNCEINGKVLVIPLTGHGTISVKLDPTEVTANIKGKIIKRDDVEYYKITDLQVDMPLIDGVVRFDNFVGATPEIVDAINQVFKENSKEMINELAAPIQQITLDVTKILFDGISSRVPYDKMFPLV